MTSAVPVPSQRVTPRVPHDSSRIRAGAAAPPTRHPTGRRPSTPSRALRAPMRITTAVMRWHGPEGSRRLWPPTTPRSPKRPGWPTPSPTGNSSSGSSRARNHRLRARGSRAPPVRGRRPTRRRKARPVAKDRTRPRPAVAKTAGLSRGRTAARTAVPRQPMRPRGIRVAARRMRSRQPRKRGALPSPRNRAKAQRPSARTERAPGRCEGCRHRGRRR